MSAIKSLLGQEEEDLAPNIEHNRTESLIPVFRWEVPTTGAPSFWDPETSVPRPAAWTELEHQWEIFGLWEKATPSQVTSKAIPSQEYVHGCRHKSYK